MVQCVVWVMPALETLEKERAERAACIRKGRKEN